MRASSLRFAGAPGAEFRSSCLFESARWRDGVVVSNRNVELAAAVPFCDCPTTRRSSGLRGFLRSKLELCRRKGFTVSTFERVITYDVVVSFYLYLLTTTRWKRLQGFFFLRFPLIKVSSYTSLVRFLRKHGYELNRTAFGFCIRLNH
jgi:hypothetical protein